MEIYVMEQWKLEAKPGQCYFFCNHLMNIHFGVRTASPSYLAKRERNGSNLRPVRKCQNDIAAKKEI